MASRREFLMTSAIVMGGMALSACTEPTEEKPTTTAYPEKTVEPTATERPTQLSTTTATPTTEVEITPENKKRPETVLGVYVPFYMLKQLGEAEKLVNSLKDTGVNSLVIDIKSGYGEVNIDSEELVKILALAETKGIYTIARMPVMVDTLMALNNPSWAMRYEDGKYQVDTSNDIWLNPGNGLEIALYNAQIARAAAELGFSEIQLDYIRYPNAISDTVIPYSERVGSIANIISIIKSGTDGTGALLTADLFANTTHSDETDMGIGQDITVLGKILDGICPMAYPNLHGGPTGGADPYEYVLKITEGARRKLLSVNENGFVNPWIQAYGPEGTKNGVQKQLEGAIDGGAVGAFAWNIAGSYPRGIYT